MNLANHRTSIILAIVFAVLLSSFWFFQDFAFIVFLSLLLQLLLQPAVDAMERRRIPRGIAAAGAILLFLLLVLVLLSILSSCRASDRDSSRCRSSRSWIYSRK